MTIKNEEDIRRGIKSCLNREIHRCTKPNMDIIDSILNRAYLDGISYDVRDMTQSMILFAIDRDHAHEKTEEYCMKLISVMHLMSKDKEVEE